MIPLWNADYARLNASAWRRKRVSTSAGYSARHGSDMDAVGTGSRPLEPDEPISARLRKAAARNNTRGANQAYPTSVSPSWARASELAKPRFCPESESDSAGFIPKSRWLPFQP